MKKNRRRSIGAILIFFFFFSLDGIQPLVLHASENSSQSHLTDLSRLKEVFQKCLRGEIPWTEYQIAREEYEKSQKSNSAGVISDESVSVTPKEENSRLNYDSKTGMVTTPGKSWVDNSTPQEMVDISRESIGVTEDSARLKRLLEEGEKTDELAKTQEAKKKVREMKFWEKAFWSVVRAVLPTVIVMAGVVLLGAFLGPVGIVIAGILLGAITSATMTYAYERRMNTFLPEDQRKEQKVLVRDAIVAAISGGISGAVNAALPGMGSLVSSTVSRIVIRTSFATIGNLTASLVAGQVKNTLNDKYLKYNERIKKNEKIMNELAEKIENGTASDDEIVEVKRLFKETARMKSEYYTSAEIKRDIINSAISGALMAGGGRLTTDKLAQTDAIKNLSVKFFGTLRATEAIARIAAEAPWAFVDGTSRAVSEKRYLDEKMKTIMAERDALPPDSPLRILYDEQLKQIQIQKNSINPLKKGAEGLGQNLLSNALVLGVEYGKQRFINDPKNLKKSVEESAIEADPEAKAVAKAWREHQAKYSERKLGESIEAFEQRTSEWKSQELTLREDFIKEKSRVLQEFKETDAGKARYAELLKTAKDQMASSRRLELARIKGDAAYRAQMIEELKKIPQNSQLSSKDLGEMADRQILADCETQSAAVKQKIEKMNQTLDEAKELLQNPKGISRAYAQELSNHAYLIRPSTYRTALMQGEVSRFKAHGFTDSQIAAKLPEINSTIDAAMQSRFGNSLNQMRWEIVSEKFIEYKYDPAHSSDESVKIIVDVVKNKASQAVINTFIAQMKKEVERHVLKK